MSIPIPTTSYILPESTTTTSLSSIPKASKINSNKELNMASSHSDNYNKHYTSNNNQMNHDDNELPPYSSILDHLGYEEGDMFQNDIADIIAVFSYCRERYLHLPLILLGVGYGSFLAQYFIEHNKYRVNTNQKSLNHSYKKRKYKIHSHSHSHFHLHRFSKKNKKKHNKNYYNNDDLLRHNPSTDPTIDGFILCGTNFMKGLLFRTNEIYANLLYYIKGKNYRTNFLFPSLLQAYKLQNENEHFGSDSDSLSSSLSNASYDSFIESPNDNMNRNSKDRLSVPRITFPSSEIQKEKPINQWYTRNYYELTKVQQDPFCNFCYSINFYRSLLSGTGKLYKKEMLN